MTFEFTERFHRQYKKLPADVKERLKGQLHRLLADPSHPSLRVKRVQGTVGIWEASVTDSIRMTFSVRDDTYVLRNIGSHEEVFRKP